MPEHETSVCSSYEFLHSFRDKENINSTDIPEYNSPNAVKAFKKLKEIKKELSEDILFEMSDDLIIRNLYKNKVLFARFWDNVITTDLYYATNLPGGVEGLSSSCVNTVNVGINNVNITDVNREASLKILQFFFSEKIQR